MKHLIKLLLSLLVLAACSSPGRQAHDTFSTYDDYDRLRASLEELKIDIVDGSTTTQFEILRFLRYASKHMDGLGKQELAVEGLVFTVAFSDDGDVQEQAETRLDAILGRSDGLGIFDFLSGTKKWEETLQLAVIRNKAAVVAGTLGFYEDESQKNWVSATSDAREEAMEFLIDYFVDIPTSLQYEALNGFEHILTATFKDQDEQEFQLELQEMLWDATEAWLNDDAPGIHLGTVDLASVIKRRLVALASQYAPERLVEWSKQNFLESSTGIIAAEEQRVSLYVQSNTNAPEMDLSTLETQPVNFLATHLSAYFSQNTNIPKNPTQWALVSSQSEAPLDRQWVINQGLKGVSYLSVSDEELAQWVQDVILPTEQHVELLLRLELLNQVLTHLKPSSETLTLIADQVIQQVNASKDNLAQQRLYFDSLLALVEMNQELSAQLKSMVAKYDLVTRHHVLKKLEEIETAEPPAVEEKAEEAEMPAVEEKAEEAEMPAAEEAEEAADAPSDNPS